MTTPRWDSRNAEMVRAELVRRVELDAPRPEGAGGPVRPPVPRAAVVRLAVAFLIALALIVPASVFAFSIGGGRQPAVRPSTSASSTPSASATAGTPRTCAMAQLSVREPGPGGATTGDWVQLIEVRDAGSACTLPASAFTLAGRVAQPGGTARAGGFDLAAGSTTMLSALTNIGCGDGSGNTSKPGAGAEPLVLRLGTRTAPGLTQRLPVVACAGLVVDEVR